MAMLSPGNEEATPWPWVWVCTFSRCPRHDRCKIHAFTDPSAEVRETPYVRLFGFSHTDSMCAECGGMGNQYVGPIIYHREDCTREGKIIDVGWIDKYSQNTYDQRLWVKRADLPSDVLVYEDAYDGYMHDVCTVAPPFPIVGGFTV